MAKRRGNGEGSIYRRPDGKWCATLTVGYDQNSKRRRRYLYGRTKAGVLEKLDQLRSDARSGTAVEPSRIKVGEFVNNWLETVAKQRIRTSTRATYGTLIDCHIVPHLGGSKLSQLAPLHLQAWLAALERSGVSPRQREAAFVLLKTILRHALRIGLIASNRDGSSCSTRRRSRTRRIRDRTRRWG